MCSPSHISACGVCVVGRQAQTLSTVPGPEEAAERVCYCKENVPDICNMSCPCKVWVDAWAPPITASYPIPVLSPVLWFIWDWGKCRSPYMHSARNRGDCWDIWETVSLRSSRYPPEQVGWRMQLRFRGAQVPGERCWHWVSASQRTDHECQWPRTLGTHAI